MARPDAGNAVAHRLLGIIDSSPDLSRRRREALGSSKPPPKLSKLEDGVLYVSMKYRTVMHQCCRGCGSEVATPLSATDWKLTFDGVSISLSPSVGNWSLPCRSHYRIERDVARRASDISDERIAAIRDDDNRLKKQYYGKRSNAEGAQPKATPGAFSAAKPVNRLRSVWAWLWPRK